jgi:uncharacterized protein (TIGR02757 family)
MNPKSNANELLKAFLDKKADQWNRPGFIADDPISIPHMFEERHDIEIMGLFASILAWGQRKTIIQSSKNLIRLFEGQPYAFISGAGKKELKKLDSFKHRTFNGADLQYFVRFIQFCYAEWGGLENAFFEGIEKNENQVENGLIQFRKRFMQLEGYQTRHSKHVSSPLQKSACKRLNMYLRWMGRKDKKGVDFGFWQSVSPAVLICPCDVHVERIARSLGLIQRPKPDWQMALELTENLRKLDPADPVKYDFALFGLGIEMKNETAKSPVWLPENRWNQRD